MTNREYYKEQIFDLACSRRYIAFNKETNTLCCCSDISCTDCLFNAARNCCDIAFKNWLNAEHVEPCPFEEGELVEVSDDGNNWLLRYFSHIDKDCSKYKYITYIDGFKENKYTTSWLHCRKYGTLGGLVKENEE